MLCDKNKSFSAFLFNILLCTFAAVNIFSAENAVTFGRTRKKQMQKRFTAETKMAETVKICHFWCGK